MAYFMLNRVFGDADSAQMLELLHWAVHAQHPETPALTETTGTNDTVGSKFRRNSMTLEHQSEDPDHIHLDCDEKKLKIQYQAFVEWCTDWINPDDVPDWMKAYIPDFDDGASVCSEVPNNFAAGFDQARDHMSPATTGKPNWTPNKEHWNSMEPYENRAVVLQVSGRT